MYLIGGRRRVLSGGMGTPASLFGDKLVNRVAANLHAPASRARDGNVYYADGKRQGTVRAIQPGRCADFNGTDEDIESPSLQLNTAADAWSVAVRARWDNTTGTQMVFQKGTGLASAANYLLQSNGTSLQVLIFNTDNTSSIHTVTSAISATTWHDVLISFDGSTVSVWIDGVAKTVTASGSAIGTLRNTVQPLHLGQSGAGANYFSGQQSDFRLFDRVSTASHATRIAAMKPGSADIGPTDAVLWYPLDEGPEVGTAFNIGSLGSAGDGTVTSSALTTFRNAALNDQYSRQNEVGYNDSPCVDANGGSSWDGSIVGTTALDGEFQLDMWQQEWPSASELFVGVSTASRISTSAGSGAAYQLITGSGGYGFDVNGAATAIEVRANGVLDYTESGVSNRVYKLTIKRGADDVVRFLIDDVEVHTESSVTDAFYFVQASSAATTRPHPYWQLSKDGVAIDPWTEVEARGTAAISHGMPVPIRPSDGKDIYGYTPRYTGQCPRDMTLSGPCGTFDGTAYLAVASLTGSETVTSSGGTSTPSISAGRIDFTAGTCWNLVLSNGETYTFSEQSGTTVYGVVNGVDGTLTSVASLATFWGTQQTGYDTLIKNGYSRSGGANVPAMEDGSGLAADGSAIAYGPGVLPPGCSLDLSQGEANSPYAQRLADELTDLTYEFGDGDEADVLFVRGDSNYEEIALIHPAATGADLTLLNNWSS